MFQIEVFSPSPVYSEQKDAKKTAHARVTELLTLPSMIVKCSFQPNSL